MNYVRLGLFEFDNNRMLTAFAIWDGLVSDEKYISWILHFFPLSMRLTHLLQFLTNATPAHHINMIQGNYK